MQEKWRAVSLAGRLGKERSTAGRRGREGQKGTAALRAAPPLENPVESRLGRAPREALPRRHWKSPQKAALDEPIGKHRLGDPAKARGRPPQTSPSASIASATLQNPAESRLGRAHRQASSRRPCKSPQKAALDEPIGKHRRGVRARHPMAGGWVKKEVRPGGGGKKGKRVRRRCAQRRRWKIPWKAASDEPNGKHRLGGPAKSRRKPPRTSPSASIVSATVRGIVGRAAG